MRKIILLLICFQTTQAEISINAGLGGTWHDNNAPGRGFIIEVIPDNNIMFVGWFTYHPEFNHGDNQYWLTMQGPYSGSVAELTIYKTNNGQFTSATNVQNVAVGVATIWFESCYQATINFTLNEFNLTDSINLNRVTPDVYCLESTLPSNKPEPKFNFPPKVTNFLVGKNQSEINFSFDLSDTENDPLALKFVVVSPHSEEVIYEIPMAHLHGHVKYPVLTGTHKTVSWDWNKDSGFQQLSINQFKVKLIADDRFTTTIQDIVDLVSTERLVADIQAIEGVRHHQANSNGLTLSRNYIHQQMEIYGVSPTEQIFNHAGSQGINIIGTHQAVDNTEEVYIIDGHYDTVASTPGADDNASGTAGMLETMRVLTQFNSMKKLKFIGFDKEELGLVGSRFYARNKEPNEIILGLINFEMIGYTCTDQPECINFPNADTSIYNIKSSFANTLSDTFIEIGRTLVPDLKITAVTDDGDSNFRRSDHAPFWDIGVDALFITDGANFRTPHYHRSTDRLPTLDHDFMSQVVKTAVGTIATLAEINHSGYAVSDTINLNE